MFVNYYYTRHMDESEKFTTPEVAELLNLKVATILAYARKHNIYKIGNGTRSRYIWFKKDIEEYIKYKNNPKKYNHKNIIKSDKYNTLFVRLKRAKQKNDLERIEIFTKELEELKKNKKGGEKN